MLNGKRNGRKQLDRAGFFDETLTYFLFQTEKGVGGKFLCAKFWQIDREEGDERATTQTYVDFVFILQTTTAAADF